MPTTRSNCSTPRPGASERAVFIDAPLYWCSEEPGERDVGADTVIALSGPTFCAPEHVPRMVLTSPTVRISSHSMAVVVLMP